MTLTELIHKAMTVPKGDWNAIVDFVVVLGTQGYGEYPKDIEENKEEEIKLSLGNTITKALNKIEHDIAVIPPHDKFHRADVMVIYSDMNYLFYLAIFSYLGQICSCVNTLEIREITRINDRTPRDYKNQ